MTGPFFDIAGWQNSYRRFGWQHFNLPTGIPARKSTTGSGRADGQELLGTSWSAERERDLEIAQRVQRSFLPQHIPDVAGVQIYVQSQPATHVGGDYYDVLENRDGQLVCAVGDISGKGLGAALFMPVINKLFRTGVATFPMLTPSSLVEYASANLYAELARAEMFATAFAAIYDPQRRTIRYANAGHSPVILHTAQGETRLLAADGMPLGIRSMSGCIDRELTMASGDVLIMATDGFAEARNRSGKMLGYEQLMQLVGQIGHESAASIGGLLFQKLAGFEHNRAPEDDKTLVIIKAI